MVGLWLTLLDNIGSAQGAVKRNPYVINFIMIYSYGKYNQNHLSPSCCSTFILGLGYESVVACVLMASLGPAIFLLIFGVHYFEISWNIVKILNKYFENMWQIAILSCLNVVQILSKWYTNIGYAAIIVKG